MISVVTPLRNTPSLMDIACWLRLKADQVEAHAEQGIVTLLIVTEDEAGEVVTSCLGANPPRTQVAGLLMTAAMQMAGP